MSDQATMRRHTSGAPVELRVLAYIADLCVAATVIAVAMIIYVATDVGQAWHFLLGGVAVAIIGSVILHATFGASPGKILADLRVVDGASQRKVSVLGSLIRSVSFNVLAPLAYLPAWTIIADSLHRGLHDKVSSTAVVDSAELVSDRPATSAGPLGGLVGPDTSEDSGLQRIPTPLPGGSPVPAGDAATLRTAGVDGSVRERLQPPAIPPLPDDVPGLRPIPPRFGPPLAPGEQPAPPLGPAALTSPPRVEGHQPPRPAPSGTRPSPGAPVNPAPRPLPPRPAAPTPLQTAGIAAPTSGGVPIVLRFDDGHAVDVRGDGLIGREPVIPPRLDAQKVTMHVLVDDTASVSKTHLLFGLTRGELWVEDVGSTNGSAIAFDESWTELTRGVRYAVEKGSVVHIGQRSFKVLAG